jgi:hypothetical protein
LPTVKEYLVKKLIGDLFVILAIVSLGSEVARGQLVQSPSQARDMALRANTAKLKVTVILDRDEYLPGEAPEITISISNSTTGPLEVFEPFKVATAGFWVDAQRGAGQTTDYRPAAPVCCADDLSAAPTRLFASGEIVARTLRVSDQRVPGEIGAIQFPKNPGAYKLYYMYGGVPVNFRVVAADLMSEAYIPLATGGEYTVGKQTTAFRRRVPIAVLQAAGRNYVVASLNSATSPVVRDNQGRLMPGWTEALAPFVRVASHDQEVTAISGTERANPAAQQASAVAAGQESLTLSWTTADGSHLVLNVGPDRKPIQ